MDQAMKRAAILLTAIFFLGPLGASALAECQIGDAKLEEAVLQNPKFRGPANRQSVRDLRSLRDAAFTLRSYGRHDECQLLLATIRELIAGPSMGALGDNDEEEAEKQSAARDPKLHRGGAAVGRRQDKDAKPLISITELAPGLRADEILGAEVRSSDDKIVGEVRNVIFGTKDQQDYAIVASGGFFTTGQDSFVVPLRSLKVSQERSSFFLPLPEAKVKILPVMPDQDYKWLADEAWRAKNDVVFGR
jgi:PRC-barrel domain protein